MCKKLNTHTHQLIKSFKHTMTKQMKATSKVMKAVRRDIKSSAGESQTEYPPKLASRASRRNTILTIDETRADPLTPTDPETVLRDPNWEHRTRSQLSDMAAALKTPQKRRFDDDGSAPRASSMTPRDASGLEAASDAHSSRYSAGRDYRSGDQGHSSSRRAASPPTGLRLFNARDDSDGVAGYNDNESDDENNYIIE